MSDIYKQQYWNAIAGDRLPVGIDYAVFDYGVNSGTAKAVKDLQRVLNDNSDKFGLAAPLKVDGVIGEGTVQSVCKAADKDEEGLIDAYCKRRMSFLKSLKTFKTFGKGWTRRVIGDFDGVQDGDRGVIDFATLMARKDLTFPLPKKELPAAIGAKEGEERGKGEGSDQAVTKTPEGIGAVVAGIGVSGQTVLSAADQVKPHINETMFGRLALIAFAVLMIFGVGLVVYQFMQKRKERK